MKIHVLVNCYWNDGISGGDKRTIEILRRWINDGVEINLYTTEKFMLLMEKCGLSLQADNLKVFVTEKKNDKNSGIVVNYFRRQRKCYKYLKENLDDGDKIYSPTDILPDVIPAWKVKQRYKTVSWTMLICHVFESFYKRPGNIISNFLSCSQQKLAHHFAKRKADTVLTISPIVYDYLKNNRYKMDKVRLVDCAVDTKILDKSHEDTYQYDAVFLARLNYSKGVLELPSIWAKVVEVYPNAKLGIIGKGEESFVKEVEDKITEIGLNERIDMLGYQPDITAYSLVRNAKLFLFTSHEEGWGMAVMEALCMGKPVVAYDLPIYRDIFKEGMYTAEIKDISGMAQLVCELLADEKRAKYEGQEGKKYILNKYNYDNISKKELAYICR